MGTSRLQVMTELGEVSHSHHIGALGSSVKITTKMDPTGLEEAVVTLTSKWTVHHKTTECFFDLSVFIKE